MLEDRRDVAEADEDSGGGDGRDEIKAIMNNRRGGGEETIF